MYFITACEAETRGNTRSLIYTTLHHYRPMKLAEDKMCYTIQFCCHSRDYDTERNQDMELANLTGLPWYKPDIRRWALQWTIYYIYSCAKSYLTVSMGTMLWLVNEYFTLKAGPIRPGYCAWKQQAWGFIKQASDEWLEHKTVAHFGRLTM